jgi:AraC-like DNA-binding protein
MKIREIIINEVSPGKQYNKPWTDGDGGGSFSFKDRFGVNLPPDDIIATGIAGTAGQKMNVAGLPRKGGKPSLAKRTAKAAKDTAYDVVNKPSPFNPLTAKDIGTERGTARYHADQIYRKTYGKEPPKATDVGRKDIDQVQLNKDRARLADIESDLAKRGYQGLRPGIGHIEIGSNTNVPMPKRKPRDPKADLKDLIAVADKTSLDAARMGAATALDATRDQREKKRNENIRIR